MRTGGQADRRTGGQVDRQTGRQADRQTVRQAGRRTGRQTDRQTGNRRTGGQTGGQADRRQANRRTGGAAVMELPTPSNPTVPAFSPVCRINGTIKRRAAVDGRCSEAGAARKTADTMQ